jgi:hypothetical protein
MSGLVSNVVGFGTKLVGGVTDALSGKKPEAPAAAAPATVEQPVLATDAELRKQKDGQRAAGGAVTATGNAAGLLGATRRGAAREILG